MHNIGIVGYGVVGKAIHRLFGDQVKAIFDPGYDKSDQKSAFSNLDMAVICVPTNEAVDGSAEVFNVWESLGWLKQVARKDMIVLIKSTTPPDVLEQMHEQYDHVVFSPEYIGESRYFTPFWKYPDPKEMKMHEFQIFGGSPEDTSRCVDIFIRLIGPHAKFYQTDIKTASLCKYMENSFFAMKVTFCNEWHDIAETFGVDYNELRELWLLDSRIEPMHTMVIKKDRGYGGKCYPKDTRAIIEASKENGYEPELMQMMDKVNNKFRYEGT